MPGRKVREFLDAQGVKYVTITHSEAFTAQEVAASSHISGREIVKTVMVAVDGVMSMAVLTASCEIDFHLLKKALGAKRVELADETAFTTLFSDCETGAMPPFGNLYDMPVYADARLAEDKEIAFNAGSHTELIRMAYADFERLVKPRVFTFACVH